MEPQQPPTPRGAPPYLCPPLPAACRLRSCGAELLCSYTPPPSSGFTSAPFALPLSTETLAERPGLASGSARRSGG